MAAPREQPSPEGYRQEILARSPILQDIICAPSMPTLEAIETTMIESMATISREITNFFGKKNISEDAVGSILISKTTDAATLFTNFKFIDEERIFTDEQTAEAFNTVTDMLMYMGFEIGDMGDAEKFLPEIFHFVYNFPHFFSADERERLKDPETLGLFLNGVLKTAIELGVSLNKQMSMGDRQIKPQPLQSGTVILRRDLGDSPVIFDPTQHDIPPDIRDAFADDEENSLALPEPQPPYDIQADVREFLNDLKESGDEKGPENLTS